MPVTPDERVKIRHHLGYLNVAPVMTFVLGSPAAVDAQFMVEGAMDRVLEDALPTLRMLLVRLDQTEAQRGDDQELMAVTSLGSIDIDDREQDKLARNYRYWQGRLANLLGITVNPYSKVQDDQGGGMNAPVIG